jgi:hypothetical protein
LKNDEKIYLAFFFVKKLKRIGCFKKKLQMKNLPFHLLLEISESSLEIYHKLVFSIPKLGRWSTKRENRRRMQYYFQTGTFRCENPPRIERRINGKLHGKRAVEYGMRNGEVPYEEWVDGRPTSVSGTIVSMWLEYNISGYSLFTSHVVFDETSKLVDGNF